jgi:hypothetical protein
MRRLVSIRARAAKAYQHLLDIAVSLDQLLKMFLG